MWTVDEMVETLSRRTALGGFGHLRQSFTLMRKGKWALKCAYKALGKLSAQTL